MVKYLWLDPSTGDTAVRANQPTGWVHVYYYNIDNALIVSTIPSIRQFVETHSTNAIPPSGIIGNKINLTISGDEKKIAFWESKLMNCPLIKLTSGIGMLILTYDKSKQGPQNDWVFVDDNANMHREAEVGAVE